MLLRVIRVYDSGDFTAIHTRQLRTPEMKTLRFRRWVLGHYPVLSCSLANNTEWDLQFHFEKLGFTFRDVLWSLSGNGGVIQRKALRKVMCVWVDRERLLAVIKQGLIIVSADRFSTWAVSNVYVQNNTRALRTSTRNSAYPSMSPILWPNSIPTHKMLRWTSSTPSRNDGLRMNSC